MYIISYIAYFTIIIVMALSNKDTRYMQRTYLPWAIGLMWLMIGMRGLTIGRDTMSYAQEFEMATTLNLLEAKDPLFTLVTFLIRKITDNYNIYFLIIESGYCISIFLLIKKYLRNPVEALTAITLLFLLGIYAFCVAGLRQTIAFGFVVLAFLSLERKKKKWFYYVMFIALAYGFHSSSIIIAPMFLFGKVNRRRWGFLLVVGMLFVANFMPSGIIEFLSSEDTYLIGDKYAIYGTEYESSQNYTGFFLQLILVIIAHIKRDRIFLPEETKNLFYNMAYLGLGFQSMTVVIAEFFRVSFYFCLFDIILVPLALSTYKNKAMIYPVFLMGCLFYIFFLAKGHVIPLPFE